NVEEVIIDKDIDTVTVVGNIERFLLIKKLNELGYPEKGSNTIIKTAKSYVSCALGKISE
ncbi:MAG: heavy-metal-associated domain-containing protein, partial [Flavobacteriia bacterium]|nr:heavy-metal-associated domain-containing protein [Flavobacteriia bacterium]